MTKNSSTSDGALHETPDDLQRALGASASALAAWDAITPLARNEWICWIASAKKAETRARRIERAQTELAAGKRRPCCWAGCPHRRPNAQKWFKQSAEALRRAS